MSRRLIGFIIAVVVFLVLFSLRLLNGRRCPNCLAIHDRLGGRQPYPYQSDEVREHDFPQVVCWQCKRIIPESKTTNTQESK